MHASRHYISQILINSNQDFYLQNVMNVLLLVRSYEKQNHDKTDRSRQNANAQYDFK